MIGSLCTKRLFYQKLVRKQKVLLKALAPLPSLLSRIRGIFILFYRLVLISIITRLPQILELTKKYSTGLKRTCSGLDVRALA